MQIRVFSLSPRAASCAPFPTTYFGQSPPLAMCCGSSQSPAAVFARQGIQLSNFELLLIPPFVKVFMKSLSLNYSLIFEKNRISRDSCKMDIGQADKAKPLQRCLSFLPSSSNTSGAVSVMQNRVCFPVSPGRFLYSALTTFSTVQTHSSVGFPPSPPEAGFSPKIRIVILLPAGDSVVKIQVADDASAGVDSGLLPTFVSRSCQIPMTQKTPL